MRSWQSLSEARTGLGSVGTKPGRSITCGRHLFLSEREGVRLGARVEERDLQRPLVHRVVLAHELVHAAVPEQAVPVLVDVYAARRARRLAVEEHTEGNRLLRCSRQHEMRVAR